jgi:membrane-associated phospholipid phosphatase
VIDVGDDGHVAKVATHLHYGTVSRQVRDFPTRSRHAWLLVTLLAGFVFAGLTMVVSIGGLHHTDAVIARRVRETDWGWLVPLMQIINSLGPGRLAIIALAAVVAGLVVSPTLRMLWVQVASLLLCVVLGVAAKLVVAGQAPSLSLSGLLHQEQTIGYPSNHAVAIGWLASMVVLVISPRLWPPLRPLAWGLALLLFVAVFLARVWGGEHSATDMVGGLLLTGACATLVVGLWDRLPIRR